MRASLQAQAPRRGFTLIELVVAMGLVSIVMLAVYRLLDSAMGLWSRGEVQRSLVEASSATAEILVADLRSLHPGIEGDLVAEWQNFDTDGDGIRERYFPRMRMVRTASAATVARLLARDAPERLAPQDEEPDASEAIDQALGEMEQGKDRGARTLRLPGPRLIEVVWCVVPASARAQDRDLRAEGLLMRGERLLGDGQRGSFMAANYFDGGGMPPIGDVEAVTGGILYCSFAFASQTTLLRSGWNLGPQVTDASGSWDAWVADRPSLDIHEWNEPAGGLVKPTGSPVLPRRVRLELEFERPIDRQRRTRTTAELDAVQTRFEVQNGERLPEPGAFILVDAEWMEVVSKVRNNVSVRRGQRGTKAVIHAVGGMVHYGETVVFEVPISVARDEWNAPR